MSKKDTTLDDITQSIADLGRVISQEITATKQSLEGRMDRGFEEVKGSLKALENDTKAIYKMLSSIQKDVKALRKTDKQLDRRLINLEQFAVKLSLKTGIPFES